MVPQNGHAQGGSHAHSQSTAAFSTFPPADPSSFNLLDSPHVAKQMAAMTAANQARIAQNARIASSSHPPNGTSSGSYLGTISSHSFPPNSHDLLTNSANGHANFLSQTNYGLPQSSNNSTNPSFLDSNMSQPNAARNQVSPNLQLKQRQYGFLQGLHNLMAKRGAPLPPQLTGIPSPTYDSTNTTWGIIECSKEVGSFVLAGKDVDLFKLWGLAIQSGGGQSISNANGWGAIAQHFDLPEEFPSGVQANKSASVATMLSQYYMALLYPFEELYKKNMQEQQKKGQTPQRPGGMPGQQFPIPSGIGRPTGMPGMQQPGMRGMNPGGGMSQAIPSANGLNPYPPMHNQVRPNTSQNPHQISATDSHSPIVSTEMDTLAHTVDSNLLDQDTQGIKRKYDQDGGDSKRARQKTDPPENGSMLMSMTEEVGASGPRQESQPPSAISSQSRPRQQATRRKIEYVPLAREVDTYGGRDLHAIDQEWHSSVPRRPLRDINDWGVVDIECLCMSIRSRLSVELSYALTTLTVLSTMKGQAQGSGFPIYNCPDLLDDILDLMEECAFGEAEAKLAPNYLQSNSRIYTNRELVALVQEMQTQPFAPLSVHQGAKDPALGPQQRPANFVLVIITIIRNMALIHDNTEFVATHPRLIDMLLRLCDVEETAGRPPAPTAKNLSVADVVLIRKETMSILMGAGSMINLAQSSSSLTTLRMTRRAFELFASYLVDPAESVPPLATVQMTGVPPNTNRRPPPLVDMALDGFTRFSQGDGNRQVITKAVPGPTLWLLLERLVHRLPLVDADFVFLQRESWLSYIEKIVMSIYSLIFLAPYELKQKIKTDRRLAFKQVMFRMAQRVLLVPAGGTNISARRAIEAMKLLDNAEESSDTSESTIPILSFGMGFSDGGDASVDKGTGILGGNRGASYEMLLMRDVNMDIVFFNELDSLVRVQC